MKTSLLLIFFGFFVTVSFAQKTWVGPDLGIWSDPANWSPSGVPGIMDTVIFSSGVQCNVDIDPAIASLRTTGAGITLFSASTNRIITINNSGAAKPVLHVGSGSVLFLGGSIGSFAVSITTYGATFTNNAQVLGNLFFNLGSTWTPSNGTNGTTNIDISGNVTVPITSTAANIFINSAAPTLRFLSGSNLFWGRNGGNIPLADYRNGSGIYVSAISNTMVSFSNLSTYNGLITWDCPAQTISGSAAVLLPTTSAIMDSVFVKNTGTGTLRLVTEPNNYILGHVEVEGGTLELSAPVVNFRTGTITTNLKITGGNVIGNATYVGDVGSHYPMTLTVNGNLIMSGGSFDLTNRPSTLNPGGAFQCNVKGNVVQTAGVITATTAFGSQNQLMLNGTVPQNVEMLNFTGPIVLVINNAAGVTLQNSLNISYVINFISGTLTTSAANLLTMGSSSLAFGASNASFVNGPVSKIGNSPFVFPVGKTNCGPSGTKMGYAAIEIANLTGAAVNDQYTAEYIRASAHALGGITTGMDHVSACDYWRLERIAGTATADIILYWKDSINNCTYATPYIDDLPSLVVAHFDGSTWNAIGVAGINSGTPTSGTVTWGAPQSNQFGIFAIGSIGFLNPLPISINYFNGVKQNNDHVLNWKLTCNSTPNVTIEMERSTDGINFNTIYSIFATALRCQQPFDHTDNQPAKGINYYRLKMTDATGKITYSSQVSLINATKGIDVMNIAPNPVVSGSFNLKISAAEKMQVEILITDMQGRLLKKQTAGLIAGFNAIPVEVRNLAAGTYQLFGNTADGRTRVLRFVIQ